MLVQGQYGMSEIKIAIDLGSKISEVGVEMDVEERG